MLHIEYVNGGIYFNIYLSIYLSIYLHVDLINSWSNDIQLISHILPLGNGNINVYIYTLEIFKYDSIWYQFNESL